MIMCASWLILLLLSIHSLEIDSGGPSDDNLIVQLVNPVGKIRGHILKSHLGEKFFAFQDIPYATPPLGQLRFKAPQRHKGWEGILDTTNNTRVCPQLFPTILPQDEDCLRINVYTPVNPNPLNKLAVYAWIHGGSYMFWDNTINRYGPQYLIDYDIVVVTFNYRLGSFGFLATEDGIIPGNLGLRDQTLAMRWIQDNIHLFGGDPTMVTIGGESSGASSVGLHLLSPLSKGLFRGAILESSSPLNTYNYQVRADHYAFELGRNLDSNLEYGNSSRLLEILQGATVSEILDAQSKVVNLAKTISLIPDIIWAPTIETAVKEVETFLSKPVHQSFINNDWNQVPILAGYNSEEFLMVLNTSMYKIPGITISLEEINDLAANLDDDPSRLINDKYNILNGDKKDAGAALKKCYTNSTFLKDLKAYMRFCSEIYFNLGALRLGDLASRIVPVYLYEFSYTPFTNNSIVQGAVHTEELQYFWKNIEDFGDVNDFQSVLRGRMLKLWTNFIKYQNPTPAPDESLENITWPVVTPTDMLYLDINSTLEVKSNTKKYSCIRDIFYKYMKPPMFVY